MLLLRKEKIDKLEDGRLKTWKFHDRIKTWNVEVGIVRVGVISEVVDTVILK